MTSTSRLLRFKKVALASASERTLAIALQRKPLDVGLVLTLVAQRLGIKLEQTK